MLLHRAKAKPFHCDASMTDPTGTLDLRRKYRSAVEMRWNAVRKLVRDSIIGQNILGTGKSVILSMAELYVGQSIGLGSGSDTKIKSFQMWMDNILKLQVLGQTGGWAEPMVVATYDRGVARAQKMVGTANVPEQRSDVIGALQAMVFSELQGIVEAVSQKAVRAVAYGVLHNYKPIQIFRTIADDIQKVGVNRSRAMVDMMVVKTYGQATLDTFKAAGILRVGLLSERQPVKKKVRDDNPWHDPHSGQFTTSSLAGSGGEETAIELAKVEREAHARAIANVRSAQKGEAFKHPFTPREQYRAAMLMRHKDAKIKSVKGLLETLLGGGDDEELVEVLTAGDDDVCQECQDISQDGPYDIEDAYDLIPAHPHCRCAFVPWGDARFALIERDSVMDEFSEELHPRDPDGKFGEGGGESKPAPKVFGGGKNKDEVVKAVASLSDKHRALVSDVSFVSTDTITDQRGLVGSYGKGMGGEKDKIKVADRVKLGSGYRDNPDAVGTTYHEVGHAIDDRVPGASSRLKSTMDEDVKNMTDHEKKVGKYWLQSNRETFAETYKLAYSPAKGTAFGMDHGRASKVFAKSVEAMKKALD